MGEPIPAPDLSPCRLCVHLRYVQDHDMEEVGPDDPVSMPGVGVWACPAFPWPKGIPDEIFYGDNLHLTPWPGQVGDAVCTPRRLAPVRCTDCFWFLDDSDEFTCPAYPSGIPIGILQGDVIHNEVRGDQKGDFVFRSLFPHEE